MTPQEEAALFTILDYLARLVEGIKKDLRTDPRLVRGQDLRKLREQNAKLKAERDLARKLFRQLDPDAEQERMVKKDFKQNKNNPK